MPISRRKIIAGVLAVGLVTIATVVTLWWAGTRGLQGKDLVAERLDALKVGLSIGVGSGGLFALYLGWRRQRSTELTEARNERVDADARLDARERRITELYSKSADQLGSDKAAVRLAGLYAMERLAQDNPPQRQTVLNVLCAYLRMPFQPPGPGSDEENRERAQEHEVRSAAQRILRLHLQDSTSDALWPDADIDLTGAVLVDFSLSRCQVRTAVFNRATFHGTTGFGIVRVAGNARFNEATFTGDARFSGAEFGGIAGFAHATFEGHAWFDGVRFRGPARFNGAEFADDDSSLSDFSGATFAAGVPPEVARFLD